MFASAHHDGGLDIFPRKRERSLFAMFQTRCHLEKAFHPSRAQSRFTFP
jgi:hypothetical protein